MENFQKKIIIAFSQIYFSRSMSYHNFVGFLLKLYINEVLVTEWVSKNHMLDTYPRYLSSIRLFFIYSLPYLMIFQSTEDDAAENFEKASNEAKIWPTVKKNFVQFALNSFFGWFQVVPKNQNLGNLSATTIKYVFTNTL